MEDHAKAVHRGGCPTPLLTVRTWPMTHITDYLAYYHRWRTHLSLAMDCPQSRPVEPPEVGEVIVLPEVGGLRHHYTRQAA